VKQPKVLSREKYEFPPEESTPKHAMPKESTKKINSERD
jgi:hypothetical protein